MDRGVAICAMGRGAASATVRAYSHGPDKRGFAKSTQVGPFAVRNRSALTAQAAADPGSSGDTKTTLCGVSVCVWGIGG